MFISPKLRNQLPAPGQPYTASISLTLAQLALLDSQIETQAFPTFHNFIEAHPTTAVLKNLYWTTLILSQRHKTSPILNNTSRQLRHTLIVLKGYLKPT